MHTASFLLTLYWMALAAPANSAFAQSSPTTLPDPGRAGQAVEALLLPQLAPNGAGCAVSATLGGRVVLERSWGLADLEHDVPITPNTVFEAGSVSKQFTAAAIAVLVADGRISLDDDVSGFVPELRVPPGAITIRRLLTHTSGIRNWDDLVELAGRPREDATAYSQREALDVILRQSATNFPSGTEYLYSNSNYVLAAVVVERVTGMPFAAFSSQRLFEPLGMTDTQWRDDRRRRVARRASAWTPDASGAPRLDMPLEDVIGPGGLLTTVRDLQRWSAVLDEPPPAAARWVAILTRERAHLVDGTLVAYGLGLEHEDYRGREVVSHAGATAGYRAYLARVPQARLSVALLCNAGQLNTEDLGPEVVAAMLGDVAPRSVPSGRVPKLSPVHASVEGRFRNIVTRQLVELRVANGRARFNDGAPFGALDARRWSNEDATRTATLERDARGAVTRIRLSRVGNAAVTLERVERWTPDADTLVEFAGRFASEDVGAEWTFVARRGGLSAEGPRGMRFEMEPIHRDTFRARDAYWIVAFERGESGVVARARFYKTRTRGVEFVREDLTRAAP